jgi:demethylmenaquinone methyltransferase/2-methoxy-6-polyprenyl-1,4-benzoquinol methylase
MSKEMVALGQVKVRKLGLQEQISLEVGDAQHLPYASSRFDAVTMSFGIRNVADVDACLREMYRVLKPKGRTLILEFSLPHSAVIRMGHLFYLRKILPLIGRLLSGHPTAYSYLNQTIEEFPYGERFLDLLRSAGFQAVSYKSLSFGIVNLYRGDKR